MNPFIPDFAEQLALEMRHQAVVIRKTCRKARMLLLKRNFKDSMDRECNEMHSWVSFTLDKAFASCAELTLV